MRLFPNEELIKMSKSISDLCVDRPDPNKNHLLVYIHSLPLKDPDAGKDDLRNWDITPEQKGMVISIEDDLLGQAQFLWRKCSLGVNGYNFHYLNEELLPPWIMFPRYARDAVGWKTDIGEAYKWMWNAYLKSLTPEEKENYKSRYPFPVYFKSRIDDLVLDDEEVHNLPSFRKFIYEPDENK